MSRQRPQEDQVGVPCKLLKEFIKKKVTIDTATGELYTGTLIEAEDNMSCTLTDVVAVMASGYEKNMTSVYVKGAKIRCINLPPEAKEKCDRLNRENRPPTRGRGGRGGRGGGGGRFGGDRRRY